MPPSTSKIRLDMLLTERGLVDSRARGRDAILRGHVHVNGTAVTKPGETVSADAEIALSDPAAGYVSRAALKLIAGLDAFGIDIRGKTCLDVGASTGGFTQVLLERGATHVTAIDVGHGQMHASLLNRPDVSVVEGLNARELAASDLHGAPDIVVCDVSFISLKLALPPALRLAASTAAGVFLVKPQFEVGRDGLGKGGLVKPGLGEAAAEDLRHWLDGRDGWTVTGLKPSPIAGGDGNLEYLLGATRG